MEIRTLTVEAADGRELCVELAGEDGLPLVVALNGTPNSRHLSPEWVEDAARRGIRIASYDRPGYGRSTAQPGRTVADCAADVRAIATGLGAERVAVWGISGGGPHALACAALLPDLVRAAAALASPAPYGAPGLDFFTGMGELNVADFTLLLEDHEAARLRLAEERRELLELTTEELFGAWKSLLSAPDVAWMNEDRVAFLLASMKDGLAPGDEGWWDDSVAEIGEWGFGLDSVAVPVQVWHGAEDLMVPIQHGEWLAAHVPGVDAHLLDGHGHLTLLDRVPDVHGWLLTHD